MSIFQTIILAIIEGITEFLPVSSTGHMAIASAFFKIEDDAFTKLFEVVIQLGAILSVVVLFWKKFIDFKNPLFYLKLFIAIIPSLVFGALLKKHIDNILETPIFIAFILFSGGIILLFVDNWFKQPKILEEKQISNRTALLIGFYQVLAILFPGLSRSAATIIGGMQLKLSRTLAAEFSFFLAVPTMLAATVKSLYDIYEKSPEILNTDGIQTLAIGSIIAFIVAMAAIRFFIRFIQQFGFKWFGVYRILMGSILIILILSGKL